MLNVLIQRKRSEGVSLVELVVAVGIMAVLLAVSVPMAVSWRQNLQIRSAAESIQNGLQAARTEALRRNTEVRFQLTTTVDNSCALSAEGQPNWVVNIGTNTGTTGIHDPTGKCGAALLGTTTQWNLGTTPFLVKTFNGNTNATKNVVASISSATNSLIVFNSLGQVIWPTTSTCATGGPSAGPASSASGAVACIDLTNPTGGACAYASGSMTCMRVEVTVPSGQIRMCNPYLAQGTPQGCLK